MLVHFSKILGGSPSGSTLLDERAGEETKVK